MSDETENNMTKRERPLSPHLQVYRLPYNALMSISGRGAGILLALILMIVLVWFNLVVWEPSFYDKTFELLDTPYIQYGFLALAFVIFFYIGNGLRHLLWDMGIGVNQKSGIMTGNIVLLVSVLLTLGLWQAACGCWAGYFSHEVEILEGEQNAQQAEE